MQLTQIDILKYKSIKQPVSIFFNDNQVVTFIGKNGSGKTNILEAIKYSLTKNHYYSNDKNNCKVQYHIKLTDNEIKEYFSCVQANEESKNIIVDFDSNNPEKRFLYSSAIWIEAAEYKNKLEQVLCNFKRASAKYIAALKKIESNDSYFGSYIDIQIIEENRGSVTHLMKGVIKNYENNITQQKDEIKRYMDEIFKEDKISLSNYERLTYGYQTWNLPLYRIPENEQINISPLIASSLQIRKEDLEKANKRLNKKLKEINIALETEYAGMKTCLDEFENIKRKISKTFDKKSDRFYSQQEKLNKQFESIMQKLLNIIYCNCYLLDNENSLIFYNSINRNFHNEQIQSQYLNSRNPIIEAFDLYLHEKKTLDVDVSIIQNDKVPEQQKKRAIKLLNSEFLPGIIPQFDNDEIVRFSVANDSDNSLNLYVHEKNGDIVSFNNTSLGRRWYLTYQFVKSLLISGDILLIDEPAAFLHPQAQVEFKEELNKLAQRGIKVFCTTHSPYMISSTWEHVFNVTMTEKGTRVAEIESGDDLCAIIRENLGITQSANILFNLEKTLLLVEGVSDMVCIEKFAELLRYDISSYKIMPCNGSPIFDVTYLCIQQSIKFKALFDLDNKTKPERWMNYKYGYNEYLKIFERNENCVFTPSIRQKKSLEDCFHEIDSKKYFREIKCSGVENSEYKIDKDKIKGATEFEDETKRNFEQLFMKLEIPKLDNKNS